MEEPAAVKVIAAACHAQARSLQPERGIQGEATGAGEDEREREREQQELQLPTATLRARREARPADPHGGKGNDHVDGQTCRKHPSRDAEHEEHSPDGLEQRYEPRIEEGGRHVDLPQEAGEAGRVLQLAPTVGDEGDPDGESHDELTKTNVWSEQLL